MGPTNHLTVLTTICEKLAGQPIPWVVTGSMNMVLQGMDLIVHDIDLQTDSAGAYQIEQILSAYSARPVQFSGTERIRSHYGALVIDGIDVEIMGDVQKRTPGGEWGAPTDIPANRIWVSVGKLSVPVLTLSCEYQAYLDMGRLEKAALLRKKLQEDAEKAAFLPREGND